MSEQQAGGFKPKKSVALSGVAAGNTALCTVGRSGNDLHYRGYDILDLAGVAEFEEVAFLLVHGKLPNVAELARPGGVVSMTLRYGPVPEGRRMFEVSTGETIALARESGLAVILDEIEPTHLKRVKPVTWKRLVFRRL